MELFKLLGTIAVDNQEANTRIEETTGKAEGSESRMSAAFKKIGGAVASYFAVSTIKDFGVACVNAAADANAAASQFSQVFGDMEGQASTNLSQIASDAGIMETRMKGSYTKIAAFAKTTGMDTADALSLADRAMVAVADSAAFYDRSLEDTTESLQSFLKGNFENDAALGLSCTEVTRNAAAVKLFGDEYKNLSESQKQLTLLSMVEEANALSGALGQAARESDTWTNQTGNLQQAWTDFKAMVGSNFLDAAVGGVARAAEKVQQLTGFVSDLFELWREIVQPALSIVGEAFGAVVTALQPLFAGFQGLIPASVQADGALGIIRDVCYAVEGGLLIVADKLQMVASWISANLPGIPGKVQEVFNGAKSAWESIGMPMLETIQTTMQEVWEGKVKPVLQIVQDVFMTLWDGCMRIWASVGQPIFENAKSIVENLASVFAAKMPEIIAFVGQCFSDISAFWENNLKPTFEAIISWIEQDVAPVVQWLATVFTEVFNNFIGPAVDTAFDFIVGLWNNTLKPLFTGITDFLTGVFTGNWKKAFEGIVSIVKSILSGLIAVVKYPINQVINAVNSFIKGLNKVKVPDWVPGVGGKGINIPLIPKLEKGGILEKGQIGFLEGTGAEAVVPLDQNRAWISKVANDMEIAVGGKETIGVLNKILDAINRTNDGQDELKDSFASMKVEMNNREFARLVKAVN